MRNTSSVRRWSRGIPLAGDGRVGNSRGDTHVIGQDLLSYGSNVISSDVPHTLHICAYGVSQLKLLNFRRSMEYGAREGGQRQGGRGKAGKRRGKLLIQCHCQRGAGCSLQCCEEGGPCVME